MDCSQVLRKQKQRKKLGRASNFRYTLHTDLLNYNCVTTHSYSVTLACNCWCTAGSVLLMIEIFSSPFQGTFAHFSYKLPRQVSFCPEGVSDGAAGLLVGCSIWVAGYQRPFGQQGTTGGLGSWQGRAGQGRAAKGERQGGLAGRRGRIFGIKNILSDMLD